jgi:hypothetical protein
MRVVTCMTRFGVHIIQECYELSWSEDRPEFVPALRSVPFATVTEALAKSSAWPGVFFPFDVGDGLLSLVLLDDPTVSGKTAVLEEGSDLYFRQMMAESKALRWRTLLLESASSIDADYYLMESEAPFRTLSKDEFLNRITSQAFRDGVSVPPILAFHERVLPNFETELTLPQSHRWERHGSMIEIVYKEFGHFDVEES